MGLPQNCYENDDFLGIAICSVYAPIYECEDTPENYFAHTLENPSGDEVLNEDDDLLEAESSISTKLQCQLSLSEGYGSSSLCVRHLSFCSTCKCYHNGGVSGQMWVIFYPKAAILESCHTNRFMHLNAVFIDSRNHFKVLKCGLQPIYSQDPIVQTEDVDASCLECQRNVEHRKLCLKGQPISLLPIEHASEFDTLCLRECKNLESLPTSIWEFKSLKSLFCSHCSQLQYFPEILENMENLRELHLNETAIKELPSSIEHLNRLEVLNLEGCKKLVTLPESICNLCFLEVLDVSYCSKLHKLPQNLGRLQSLKHLCACGLNSTCCQLVSLLGLCSLKNLILPGSKLMQGVVLSDICCLYSLEVLDLSFCRIDEGGIPTEICHLSSLQHLHLSGNLFRSIPSGVNQLSMLRILNLGHCQELRQIPALPSSLRVLDVHECPWLETSSGLLWSSLFNCFKSLIQDFECRIYPRDSLFARVNLIISGSCGIPKWISHHKKGAKVVAKLPENWYKNNDLLGFVLYSLYDPLDNESEETLENDAAYLKCSLTLRAHESQFVDELQFYPSFRCYDVVPKMWMIYYAKVVIEKKYHSNKWRQLTASFCGFSHGKAMKVEECGIHLIYAHDHEKNNGKAMIPTICRKCQADVQSRRKLCLKGSAINELPTIECPLEFDSLCLRECKNLERLPSSICELKSLTTLNCSGCSRLRSFPEILEDVENLRNLHLDGTAIKELPASIQYLRGLQCLNLADCTNLVSLPETICNLSSLKILDVSFCTKLEEFPKNLRSLQCLECLHASGLNLSMDCFSSILAGIIQLSKLRVVELSHCQGPLQVPELTPSLRVLDVHSCTCLETLSSPSSLLGVSLFKCFKSTIEDLKHEKSSNGVFLPNSDYIGDGICIVVPGSSGIPKWIRNQREGYRITMELPQNCYENDDFLGIAICCVYAPLDECEDIPENDFAHTLENESDDLLEAESSISTELQCQLSLSEGYGSSSLCVRHLSFRSTCKCYHNGGVSEQMWVIFYPKAAILESGPTNPFMYLAATFKDPQSHFKVLKCGLQPIYSQDPIVVQTEDVDARCLDCQRNVEHRKLCLKGQTISLLPIEHASEFDTLCLRECKNLESLPTSIWEFKSLKSLFCSHCSQLQYFPEILENMENLRELHLNETAIKELPSSIEHLNRLEVLNLDRCENLVTLPESICNLCFLEVLNVSYCSKLHKLPQNLGRLQSLKHLRACGLNSTCCQLLSLSGLCSLKNLILTGSKLIQGEILSDICCLYSLEVLDLSFCSIDEGGIPTEICHLSSLRQLLLTGNLFRSIPSGVNQLSMLRLLDLGHCQELRQIPALPSSLRVLDVHECTRLETSSGLLWSSLFNCFKSLIQDFECRIYPRENRFARVHLIISGSCGIPKWISHHKKGAKVVAELPENWYKNNDLLGFVLYSLYDPLDNESEETLENYATSLKCGLTLRAHESQFVDELRFYPTFHCYDVVPNMWMIYYPKVEIEKYHSNKRRWRQLTASFCGFLCGKAMKVEECGIHLIYAHDHEKNNGKAMIPTICQEC
uniref:TMV resistance protein N n=2 Tax=Vitis vinifera TaxID=29760 RepID=F6GW27_VITVI